MCISHRWPMCRFRGSLDRRSLVELGEIASENGEATANLSRAYLSALFSWAIGKGIADVNPVIGVHKEGETVSRDRVLSDPELRDLWSVAGASDYGRIVRLLTLTAQRREEVGGMRWSEIDLAKAIWTIPPERTKNGRQHQVPLSDMAVSLLRGIEKRADRDNVFGSGEGGFSGWSKSKAMLDKRIADSRRKWDPNGKVLPWRLHDIRRTVATGMANLGVMPHVVEAVLNHVSGSKAGVAGIYNRAAYSAEKRDALSKWAETVTAQIERSNSE